LTGLTNVVLFDKNITKNTKLLVYRYPPNADLKGNPVKIGNGPAAVTGDEISTMPLSAQCGWEGGESRMIRKSEDLPVDGNLLLFTWIKGEVSWVQSLNPMGSRIFFALSNRSATRGNKFIILICSSKKRWLLFFLFMFIRPVIGVATENIEKPVSLEPIVVTAERNDETFQTGDVDTEQTTGFFSIIQKESFEGKIENLSEVIEKEAGIQVRQSGGLGSFSTVSLRGSSSDQVMIFMDGILLNDASGGGVDLSNISLSDVEAIEIYRGITPVHFGKASIGGVVNIRTLRARRGMKANVIGGYGSFDTDRFHAFINHKPGKGDYLVSADILSSDNDFKFLNDNGTQWNPYDDRREHRHNNQFKQKNLLTKAGYDFTDNVRIDISNQWFEKDQHLPSWNNSSLTRTTFDTKRNNTFAKLTIDNVSPFHLNLSGRLYYSWKKEEYDDSQGHIGLGRQHTEYITKKYGTQFFLEWPTTWQSLNLVLNAYQEKYEPTELLTSRSPNNSKRNTFSLAIQDSFPLFHDKLVIIPGLRFLYIDDELKSAVSPWGVFLGGEDKQKNYTRPQIGAKYRVFNWLNLKVNLAQYVREPSFFELFGDRGFFIGNPDLKAEKGTNFDAGCELHWQADTPWLQRISGNAAYFKSDVDDIISRVYDARGIGKSVNISKADIEGIEAAITIDALKFFRFIGNATWQDTENKGDIRAFDGKNLPGRFEKAYLGRIEAKYKGFKLYGEYVIERGMYYDSANLLEARNKREINAGASILFHSCLFTFEGKNLNDDRYEDFNGYPLPERSFYFTVKHSFQ